MPLGNYLVMFYRTALLCVCLLVTSPLAAEELGPQQSASFVEGKLFSYNCFNGVTGDGRILEDGSVEGNVQLPDRAQKLFATLPPGTIKVEDGAVCARIAGLFIRPCFKVDRIDDKTFRGSIAGLDFAYCVFHRIDPRPRFSSGARDIGAAHDKTTALKSLNPSSLY